MTDGEVLISMPAAEALRRAAARGDDAEVVRLAESSPLEIWYGVPLDQLGGILAAIPDGAFDREGLVYSFRFALNPPAPGQEIPESTVTTANAMQARLSGNPRAALDQMTAVVADATWAQPLYDRTNGYSTFARLHLGFTQMLAGDLVAARTQIAAAKVTPPPEPLTMLLRDAYAKSAVLNAVFGSHRDAQRDIDIAATLPRTTSWAEPIVTSHLAIAECLLASDDEIPAAIHRLERQPVSVVGEMWPFWLLADFLLHLRLGRPEEGVARVEALSAATPTATAGDGFPVSIRPIAKAIAALVANDPVALRESFRQADSRVPLVRLLKRIGTVQQRHSEAAAAELVGLSADFVGLEQLDALRVGALAWSMLRTGDEESAERMLSDLVSQRYPTPPAVLLAPTPVDAFARGRVAGWATPKNLIPQQEQSRELLTERERKVLRLLASERTREQIAEELFVSVNTVKSQLSSIFRKLGVGSRLDAVLEAERLRLI